MTLNVEVLGIHHANKGARLMLEAIRHRLESSFPGHRLALSLDFPVAHRLEHGAWACLRYERGRRMAPRRLPELAIASLPSASRERLGLVRPQDVDVILDASGFAYGDFWGPKKIRARTLFRLRRWKNTGRVSVMMPQAFGPFEDPQSQALMREALSLFDLVFARDRQSLNHIRKLAKHPDSVMLAPDFTNLLHPELRSELAEWAGASFLIPNAKILAADLGTGRREYIDFLVAAARQLAANGQSAAFLIHEGAGDRQLAEEVNASLASPLPILDPPSPLDTKALIGQAGMVISSRFHGLVSALSSGVPALACGWSHKYDELMTDYGMTPYSYHLDSGTSAETAIAEFHAAANTTAMRESLARAAESQRDRSREMWTLVEELIHHQNHTCRMTVES